MDVLHRYFGLYLTIIKQLHIEVQKTGDGASVGAGLQPQRASGGAGRRGRGEQRPALARRGGGRPARPGEQPPAGGGTARRSPRGTAQRRPGSERQGSLAVRVRREPRRGCVRARSPRSGRRGPLAPGAHPCAAEAEGSDPPAAHGRAGTARPAREAAPGPRQHFRGARRGPGRPSVSAAAGRRRLPERVWMAQRTREVGRSVQLHRKG
ncbi:protein SPT2 homolog [Falco rusticolus]|uniref:protein SPT2 homolog n=1 Tax=Falco rusticolus TaxID=120794 RepID=UPI001886A71F|nr:protein SPT2 homolog [Falco rusticolus]